MPMYACLLLPSLRPRTLNKDELRMAQQWVIEINKTSSYGKHIFIVLIIIIYYNFQFCSAD